MMGKKRISISLNVRYYLNNAKFPIDYENFLRDDKGQSLKPAQARNRLYDALKRAMKSYHVIQTAVTLAKINRADVLVLIIPAVVAPVIR